MEELWKVAVGIAGIGTVGAFVFWSLYKDWLKLPALKNRLTKHQIFILFLVFLVLTFLFGIASLAAYVMAQGLSTDGPAVVIGPVTQYQGAVDKETLKKILDASTTGSNDSLAAKDQQIEELKAALERVNKLAAAGDVQAQAALEEARRSGDTAKLQAFLVRDADRIQAQSTSEEFLKLCREIATVSYLRGDIQEASFRIETILHARPNDLFALNKRGFVQLLHGELDEAQQSFGTRLGSEYSESVQSIVSGNSTAESESWVSAWQATAYGNLGLIYYTRGDLDQAEEMHQKALLIEEKLGRQEGIAAQYGNLGLNYQDRGELDRAEEMLKKALAIQERRGLQEDIAIHYGNLGLTYQKRGDLDRAEEMLLKALAIDQRLGNLEGIARHCGHLGRMYLERGDTEGAERLLLKSQELAEQLGNHEALANACFPLGLIAKIRGDRESARKLWTRARELFETIGDAGHGQDDARLARQLPARRNSGMTRQSSVWYWLGLFGERGTSVP